MSIPYLAEAAEHEQIGWLGGGVLRVLLDGGHTDGRLTVFRSDAVGGTASPVHLHDHEDEIIVLLAGSGIVWVGDRRQELSTGGVAFLPRGVPHAYRFTSPRVDMLAMATPAGMENFFRAAGWDLTKPVPDGWAVTREMLAEAAARNGQKLLGPPPDADLPRLPLP
ncbi:cupin [Virgisporangium aliadipatigenens]|uniref:Cupin n=1 Tax=Virgisporangium aliadipatigenens TaxID=741659 RepID=A0A8J3YGY6_9ACTN|nr:cupin domain-containing protein [Virgisporangium aliadipatigenens]GIJ43815.1 cupin [Virgisporangium aliadipatigenens]